MSFYTALTGLNGSSADISATSNNIANVGTTGFKRSRVEFGDIFATSPLQNASSSIGSGTILKGIKQQFTQGNIAASLNALDLAISGQGFFALKPSLTSAQTVYTRNGSLNVNNDRYVVDSAGQYLLTYPVNTDGSVTAKDLDSAVPLQLPVTSGDPQATSNIKLGVNVNAASDVVTDRPQFQDGYSFDPNDPETFTNSTSITIFDDLGNPTIATVYFIKTQAASADDPTNKYDTRLVINDTIINPDLVSAVDDVGNQIFVDRFGQQTTSIPDDNYFIEGKGSPLYKLDDLQTLVPSQPAKISGEQTSFDFGEEGDKLVEIVTDPMQFKATREAGNTGSDVYWGKDFLLVNVDDSDQPVSIDINPGLYNADQLAAEVERAINAAYGDDRKFQVEQNIDDTITLDFQRVGADGAITPLTNKISVELLGTDSYVTEGMGDDFAITGTSPDFTKEEFLAHAQIRINETLNEYGRAYGDDPLGVGGLQFVKSRSEELDSVYEKTQVVTLERVDDASSKQYLVHSFFNKRPSLSVHSVMDQVNGNGTNLIEYAATENRIRIYVGHENTTNALYSNVDISNYEQGRSITLAGNDSFRSDLNGNSYVISSTGTDANGFKYIDVSTSGLAVADENFSIGSGSGASVLALTSPQNETNVEAFFEGAHPVYEGAAEQYSSQRIIIREKQGASTSDTTKGAFVASAWNITNTGETGSLTEKLSLLGLENIRRPMILTEDSDQTLASGDSYAITLDDGAGNVLHVKPAALTSTDAGSAVQSILLATQEADLDLKGYSFSTNTVNGVEQLVISRDDMADFSISNHAEEVSFAGLDLPSTVGDTDVFKLNWGNEVVTFDSPVPTSPASAAADDTYSLSVGGTSYETADARETVTIAVTLPTTPNASGDDAYTLTVGTTTIETTGTITTVASLAADLEAAKAGAAFTISADGDNLVIQYDVAGSQTEDTYSLSATTSDASTLAGFAAGSASISAGFDNNDLDEVTAALQASLTAGGVTDYSVAVNSSGSIELTYDNPGAIDVIAYSVTYNDNDGGGNDDTNNGTIADGISVSTTGAYTTKTDLAADLQTALAASGVTDFTVAMQNGDIVVKYAELGNKANLEFSISYDGDGVMERVDGVLVDGNSAALKVSVDGGETSELMSVADDVSGLQVSTTTSTTLLANSSVDWVDEKNPPVKVGYDAINQRLSFEVDRTVLGSGTDSNFNSFSVYGSASQTGVNNLGLSNADNAQRVQIRGGEVLYGDAFLATGEEIQPNDKRYGIKVEYNSEFQNFSISSGTTGEAIPGNGAIGVDEQQKASNIQVGRYAISELTGARTAQPYNVDETIIGNGDNSLFGVGKTKNDFLFNAGTGLKATSAKAVGASANEPLTNVFKLSTQNGDNIFNVSVNGISGIIEVPATSYVGTTLAEALQTRINQVVDPLTGDTIGGVTVSYSSESNSFTFATGTTGSDSTIKVKGAARLGLDDVPLGVGTVPEIYNLVQATDADGVALYVDANGEVVTNPPENLVEGYYPLYIDEGELTFDKTGKLVSPKNLVHYEKQEEGFSIALDVDFSASTQLAQPFSVLTVEQDGFTSGRLDGIEIDSSGTIRANYTNGQNNPLGKIVVANFNNQNGLKQIGNATYTETAVSGTPQVGEAGSEGFGNILSGSLERSNVDITEELVNLITAQRNFQASAKAIETTTGLTQTIINIRM